MSKFKVGDRVEALETSGCGGFIAGEFYEVFQVEDMDVYGHHNLRLIKDSKGQLNGWSSRYFKVSDRASPIRTVTRKEIVPGVYGKVDVSLYPDGSPCVLVYFPKGAEQLREAAHILNQIAEALEDD